MKSLWKCWKYRPLYALSLLLFFTGCTVWGDARVHTVRKPEVRITGRIDTPALRECSGLARSACSEDWFWTHNDSGDGPMLYLLDLAGTLHSAIRLRDAKAKDWEDIASVRWNGRSYLLVADIGDNKLKRKSVRLYVLEDPCSVEEGMDREEWPVLHEVRFQYEDGGHNAEALGVDPVSGDLFVVTKTAIGSCGVYHLPGAAWQTPTGQMQTARRIATWPWARVTGMDINREGDRAVILTRENAYEYRRAPNESWPEAFSGIPDEILLPKREQGEAVCYSAGGALILASESESIRSPIWVLEPDSPQTERVGRE